MSTDKRDRPNHDDAPPFERANDDLWQLASDEDAAEPTEQWAFHGDGEITRTGPPNELIQIESHWVERQRFRLELHTTTVLDAVQRKLDDETNKGIWFLLSPICLGVGIVSYFSLPREPVSLAFPMLLLVLLAGIRFANRSGQLWRLLCGLALICLGICITQLRVGLLDTKMMSGSVITPITGQVLRSETRSNGSIRLTIDNLKLTEFRNSNGLKPERIRVTARKTEQTFNVGDWVTGRARLSAPPGPVYPRSFDFSFQNWFSGIGGSGFFLGAPRKIKPRSETSPSLRHLIEQTRLSIGRLVQDALPGQNGYVATALITGDRSGIAPETAEALRRSGLAHILAISGLHMALVSLTLMMMIRIVCALNPRLVLTYPTKKWAACIALVGASAYLIISGANVSTQRAYVMVAIMLVAVMIDQRALTVRNVAIAALVVLCLSPEAVLLPGFQMSFAAVAALVATYEAITNRARKKTDDRGAIIHTPIRRFLVRDVGGLALTSLVAGLATGLFAAYHFQQVAPFGLVANLLAMPLVTFFVMPFALLSVVAMPFGLEVFPLSAMAFSISGVVWVAQTISQLGPTGEIGFVPIASLIMGSVGLIILTLFRSRLRLLGFPFFALMILFHMNSQVPDIIILESGKQFAVLERNRLNILRPNADKFSTEIWRKAFAPHIGIDWSKGEQSRTTRVATQSGGFHPQAVCDDVGCSLTVKGLTVVQLKSTRALDADCLLADILIIPYAVRNACGHVPEENRALVFDRVSLSQSGALAIYVSPNSAKSTPNGGEQQSDGPGSRSSRLMDRIKVTKSYGKHPRPWTRHRYSDG